MTDKLLSPEEIADRLAVTPNTVRGWLRKGTLKGIKIGKRIWRVREPELDDFLCREQSTEYNLDVYEEDELTQEDLLAIHRGIEDIKSGRIITLDDYEQGKRP